MATLQRSNVEVARSSLGLVQSPADSPWRTLFLEAYIQAGSGTLRLAPRGYCSAGIGSLTGYVVISATTTPSMMPVANVAVAATAVVRVIQEQRRVAVIFRVPSVTFARYRVGNFAPLSVLN
jgi:hypothetical protein